MVIDSINNSNSNNNNDDNDSDYNCDNDDDDDSFKDLGLVRTSNSSYSTHCEMTAARANRAAGAMRRAFQLKAPQLLWPVFQSYVAPIAIYCSQI